MKMHSSKSSLNFIYSIWLSSFAAFMDVFNISSLVAEVVTKDLYTCFNKSDVYKMPQSEVRQNILYIIF